MDPTTSSGKSRQQRWRKFQDCSVVLPEPEPQVSASVTTPLPASDLASPYPLLCTLLRDLGLPFKAVFSPKDLSQIFGKTPHTIREWVRKGLISSSDLPGGVRFYASDLEEFLRASRRLKKGGR